MLNDALAVAIVAALVAVLATILGAVEEHGTEWPLTRRRAAYLGRGRH